MKTIYKSLLVALVAIFTIGSASADFRWGIKAGASFNNVDFKKFTTVNGVKQQVTDKSNQAGWMAGVMAEFTIPIINVGADLSLLYARQNVGADKEFEGDYTNQNFLDIPLNFKYKLSLPLVSKIIKPMVYTGPDFMFVLDKNTLDNIVDRKCEVGWNVGLGFEFFNHLQLQAGYTFGLNSVAKYADLAGALTGTEIPSVPSEDLKVKKNYWSVSAAYLF